MAPRDQISAGVKNAFAARPVVDRVSVERTLRRANRSLGRSLGRIEWVGSLEAYIRRSADLLLEGWTLDHDCPLSPPKHLTEARPVAAIAGCQRWLRSSGGSGRTSGRRTAPPG